MRTDRRAPQRRGGECAEANSAREPGQAREAPPKPCTRHARRARHPTPTPSTSPNRRGLETRRRNEVTAFGEYSRRPSEVVVAEDGVGLRRDPRGRRPEVGLVGSPRLGRAPPRRRVGRSAGDPSLEQTPPAVAPMSCDAAPDPASVSSAFGIGHVARCQLDRSSSVTTGSGPGRQARHPGPRPARDATCIPLVDRVRASV